LIAVGTLVLRAEIICVQQNIALEFLKKINGLVNEFKLLFVKKICSINYTDVPKDV